MPCYHPLPGWYARKRNANEKRSVKFNLDEGSARLPTSVPCGRCIGCRLEYSRQWAVRCMHETRLHEDSYFATLTYERDPGTLIPSHFQEFMKRLRWHYGAGIRFFQCGEYGEAFSRPHHHALLWGLRFEDARPYVYQDSSRGLVSEKLEEVWSHGRCLLGQVTFESAAYVARYSLKKVVGAGAEEHYKGRHPEFLTMSRRPGIGAGYVEAHGAEVYRDDSVIVRGVECKPPRYYDNASEKVRPEVMARIRARRRMAARRAVDNSGSRLLVREAVKEAGIRLLTNREFENG